MKQFRYKQLRDRADIPPQIDNVRAICFTKEGEILVRREPKGRWNMPGGHVENKETALEALKREVMEEACVTFSENVAIGIFELTENGKLLETHLVYAVLVEKICNMKPDPATGITNERKFVAPEEFFDYIEFEDYKDWLHRSMDWCERVLETSYKFFTPKK